VVAAETENCFGLDSEETYQFTEMESVAHETSLESDRVNGAVALESGVGENVAIQVSNLETLIRPLEIDTTNIGFTVNQTLGNQSMNNQSMVIQSIVNQSAGNHAAVYFDDLAEEQVNASDDFVESFDEVAMQQSVEGLTGSFEEEPVEDLYAGLDAKKERAFSQSSRAANASREQAADELDSTSFTQQDESDREERVPVSPPLLQDPLEPVWYSSDNDIPVKMGPEEIIDRMMPLLNEVAELPVEEMPSETPQQGQEFPETNSTEIGAEAGDQNAVDDPIRSDDPAHDRFVSNDQIGSTVFDTRLEAYRADVSQLHQLKENDSEIQPESTSRVLFSNGERLQLPVQFDVVQPEGRERFLREKMVVHEPMLPLKSDSEHSNKPETATRKRPQYDQLFSELRKRRLA
jgi:hypothetical protein